jgi:hypothetical protein
MHRASSVEGGQIAPLPQNTEPPSIACCAMRYAFVSKESHENMRAACMVLSSNEGRALTFAKTPAIAL